MNYSGAWPATTKSSGVACPFSPAIPLPMRCRIWNSFSALWRIDGVPSLADCKDNIAGCVVPIDSALALKRLLSAHFFFASSCWTFNSSRKSRIIDVPSWFPSTGCNANRSVYQPLGTVCLRKSKYLRLKCTKPINWPGWNGYRRSLETLNFGSILDRVFEFTILSKGSGYCCFWWVEISGRKLKISRKQNSI